MTTRATQSDKTKPATAKKSVASARPKATAETAKTKVPSPSLVTETPAVVGGSELRKKELLDMVVERTGVKKKFAKPVAEAIMDILGDALAEGRELNLHPMGKIKQQRSKEVANARVIVAKIRQSRPGNSASDNTMDTLADAAE